MKKSRKRSLFILLMAIAGFCLWFVLGYTLPVYNYESSDRGMAEIEIPWKGRDLSMVEAKFQMYKNHIGNPAISLCRTSERSWLAPNLWKDNLTNRRWNIPYMSPSPNPKTNYFVRLPADQVK